MILEPARRSDASALASVHAESFAHPWNEHAIRTVLASAGAYAFLVRETEDGLVSGFALGRTIAGEAELLTLAVARDARRKGLARALVSAVMVAAQGAGATSIFLEVAEDNGPALALYRALGFQPVGRRVGYYRRGDGSADALILRLDLNTARP